jgi:hypothetical protein
MEFLDIPLIFPADLQAEDSSTARRSLRERAIVHILETLKPLIHLGWSRRDIPQGET